MQIERRRAERKRAAQLEKLTPVQRQEQLALELKTALDQAKAAKASGNGARKRVAGDVIRHIRQEIGANGFKEADIHALIAQRFSYQTDAPAPPIAPPALLLDTRPAPVAAAQSDASSEAAVDILGVGGARPGPACAGAEGSVSSKPSHAPAVAAEGAGSPAHPNGGAEGSEDNSGFDLNAMWYALRLSTTAAATLCSFCPQGDVATVVHAQPCSCARRGCERFCQCNEVCGRRAQLRLTSLELTCRDDEDALASAETVKAKKPKEHALAWCGSGAEADADLSLLMQATTRQTPLKPRKDPPAALPVRMLVGVSGPSRRDALRYLRPVFIIAPSPAAGARVVLAQICI